MSSEGGGLVPSKEAKSYCKTHEDSEIVFACYECQAMCCQKCSDKHKSHTIVFFKDNFVYPNYDNVRQVQQTTAN